MKLLFTYKPGFFSQLIKFFTWSDFSHVDVINEADSSSDVKKITVIGATFWHGVEEVALLDRIAGAKTFTVLDISDVPLNTEAYIIDYLKAQLGKKYDWGAILDFIGHRNWQQDEKWFCSELVAHAFKTNGYALLNHRVNRITPRDLLGTPYGKIVDNSVEYLSNL